MRLSEYAVGAVLGVVLAILMLTTKLTLLSIIGISLTTLSGLATWVYFSMARKTKRLIDSGDYKTNRAEDVTHENRPPPAVLDPGIAYLMDQGFRRLGEEATITAEGNEMGREWMYLSADGEIIANLVPVRAIIGGVMFCFQTIFPDYAWLLTFYPARFPMHEAITLPDFRMKHTDLGLQEALDLHRAELADFRQQHGTPIPVNAIADSIKFADGLRDRHMHLVMRRGVLMSKAGAYVWSAATVIALIGALLSNPAPALAILLYILSISGLCIYVSYIIPMYSQTARLFQLVVVLSWLLIPISMLWPPFILGHMLLLASMLVMFHRMTPASIKAFSEELKTTKTGIDWQVDPSETYVSPGAVPAVAPHEVAQPKAAPPAEEPDPIQWQIAPPDQIIRRRDD